MLERTQEEIDELFMLKAMDEAAEAFEEDEVPIGAIVVVNGKIIARAHNLTERLCDVTAHAEMQAITAAANYLGGKYLTDCTIYVTVEPCAMCAAALGWAQIGRVVYGAADEKRGYRKLYGNDRGPFHPKTKITPGLLADESSQLMKSFFRSKR
ncbi:MAG: nucleoside deaminase [Muribaculaceae bacterium]|nr:nucleoside deaminase [Muribaculaceae bacterium]